MVSVSSTWRPQGLPPRAFNKRLSIEPTMPGLVLQRRKQTNKSLQVRPEPTLPLSPDPSNASSGLGEGHSCFQLAKPVSQLPFRTQHLLSHPRTDRLSGRQAVHLWVSTLPFSRRSLKASCVRDFWGPLNISCVRPAPTPPRPCV